LQFYNYIPVSNSKKMDGLVFISYSRVDKDRINRLVDYLIKNEIPVWWDNDIQGGENFSFLIGDIIDKAACIIVAWSAASVASEWVLAEASKKANKKGLVVPVVIDKDIEPPLPFNTHHRYFLTDGNFSEGIEIKKLLECIQSILKYGRPVNDWEETLADNQWSINIAVNATDKVRELVARLGSLREVMMLEGKPVSDIQLALKEVEKTYTVVLDSISSFLAPLGKKGKINPKLYLKMEGGSLLSAIKKGHGHCTLILTHYTKAQGLRDWLIPKLNPEQLRDLDAIFSNLGTADGDMFREMAQIGETLTNEARVILNLLLSDQQNLARTRLMDGRNVLRPLEDKLSLAYTELQEIQQKIGSAG
jgi:TIR domain-containing protein